ncbi:MAG: aldo/keto reductase [Chloroflexi bacterium]|nr:aldo/keto reductase [Chloroflexota bacterium]
MKYRRLGRTNLTVSVIGIGTWQFGGEWGKSFEISEATRLLERARELGVNLVDTAECYGDHLSEHLVGEAIRSHRDEWIVATKFGHRFIGNFEREQRWSALEVRQQLEESLKALNVDTIDLYQFHSGADEVFDNDELWTMLDRQVVAGKVRHLGISITSGYETPHQVERATTVGAGVIQAVYNRLDRRPEADVFPLCRAHNLGVLARVPLASGFLTGKYRPGSVFTARDDVRSLKDAESTQARLRQVEEIRQLEVPEGIEMAQWALAWCLQHPAVTCVIPGCKSVAQIESNSRTADLELVREDHPQAVGDRT